jgi:hypothetical protein
MNPTTAPVNNLHLVIRSSKFADPFGEEELKGDIIVEHNRLAKKYGRCWFGKLGRLPERNKLNLFRQSIQEYQNTQLFVASKTKEGVQSYHSHIYTVEWDTFKPDIERVPLYYRYLIPEINLWLEIGQFNSTSVRTLESLHLASSGKSLLAVLSSCRTSLLFVVKDSTRP